MSLPGKLFRGALFVGIVGCAVALFVHASHTEPKTVTSYSLKLDQQASVWWQQEGDPNWHKASEAIPYNGGPVIVRFTLDKLPAADWDLMAHHQPDPYDAIFDDGIKGHEPGSTQLKVSTDEAGRGHENSTFFEAMSPVDPPAKGERRRVILTLKRNSQVSPRDDAKIWHALDYLTGK